ncbi:MAG: 4-(cytidine 5'-diphospho)-2-C-methyl-D-erythritol kinase [Bryobacteraceae bacterium]
MARLPKQNMAVLHKAAESGPVTVPAFAKINLSLAVLHKRLDGYHEIRSIFQTISLADRISITCHRARKTELTLQSSVPIPGEARDNLVIRAASRLLDSLKLHARIHFSIDKRIPMGGGLGGGSSDAAAVLLALPPLLGKAIPRERLHEIAASIGSDVPFLLDGGTALGIGRGEELYSLPSLRAQWVLLAAPGLHISSAEAYRALGRPSVTELTSTPPDPKIKRFQSFARTLTQSVSPDEWRVSSENDFEAAAFRFHPQLAAMWQLLSRGAKFARMSGSGSTLFGIFSSRESLNQTLATLRSRYPDCRLETARFVTRDQFRDAWRKALEIA